MANSDNGGKSQQMIEDTLKRVYQQTVEEDVPDRFKDLLARLKQEDAGDGPDLSDTRQSNGIDEDNNDKA